MFGRKISFSRSDCFQPPDSDYIVNITCNKKTLCFLFIAKVEAAEPLRGDITTKSPGVPGTNLIDLGRVKSWTSGVGIQWSHNQHFSLIIGYYNKMCENHSALLG